NDFTVSVWVRKKRGPEDTEPEPGSARGAASVWETAPSLTREEPEDDHGSDREKVGDGLTGFSEGKFAFNFVQFFCSIGFNSAGFVSATLDSIVNSRVDITGSLAPRRRAIADGIFRNNFAITFGGFCRIHNLLLKFIIFCFIITGCEMEECRGDDDEQKESAEWVHFETKLDRSASEYESLKPRDEREE
ncbi:hypothetical protein PMAYCL1PPCAC_05501, partial [Pristionchus mayeri]